MYLIADSGSTTCKWILVNAKGDKFEEFSTMGFNPFFHSTEFIKGELWESDDALRLKDEITHVFFYGAGCSSKKYIKIVEDAFVDFFSKAIVSIDHDLVSSAYSTYFGKPVISCILDTGSNSSYFDGERVSEEIPSLAYILGDEGSASHFAKQLVKEFCYKRLPDDIWEAFNSEYKLSDKDIIYKVYSEPNANLFLAGFMPFIARFKDHPHIHNSLVNGFREFIDIHVKCFSNWKDVEVSFIGEIAVNYKSHLVEACSKERITLKSIVESPIDNLIAYHSKYIFPFL